MSLKNLDYLQDICVACIWNPVNNFLCLCDVWILGYIKCPEIRTLNKQRTSKMDYANCNLFREPAESHILNMYSCDISASKKYPASIVKNILSIRRTSDYAEGNIPWTKA